MAGPDGAWREKVEGNVELVEGEGGDADVGDVSDGDGVRLRLLIREEGATGFAAALLVLKGSLVALAAAHRDGAEAAAAEVTVTSGGGVRLGGRSADPPEYRAPELWRGAPASPAGDMYAATAVFFECLTGAPPFQAAGEARLGWLHRTVPPPVEQVPEELRRLVERGLAKTPQHRPSSAAIFAAEVEAAAVAALGPDWERPGRVALAALASSYEPAPHQPALPEPVRLPAPRSSRIKIATVAALAAAAVVVVAFSAGDRPARQSNQAAPQPPARVTLLPTPSLAVVEPVRNTEKLPAHRPAVIAEETGSPRTASPTASPTPGPKRKGGATTGATTTSVPDEQDDGTREPVPVTEDTGQPTQPTQPAQPPASEPAGQPVLEVEASVGLPPLLGGTGLDVSVGVQTGLLGLSL
ncbi:hypothetical protein Aph01nite_60000 [Acrocarpospora phusangensis]|uniref:non-specific serine/threonine protein kinase n=1 Tax=Acrocarpospora phusangensis TaxID=1070424 RepID=A0A919QHV4_9ACTN|nr:hypothetical protein [Acrocarpospora phusangensis]GIH27690.1 hypothetical protein Aph01nite_60000 [Acrocarpospora phusangensis]